MSLYEQTGLRPEFCAPMFKLLKGSLLEMRQILIKDNQRGTVSFKDFGWRLNMVTACRQRQKMMLPKYTVKLDLEEKPLQAMEQPKSQAIVMDLDYTSMKRLQDELQDAIKSLDGVYAKRVQKFIR